MWQPSLFRSAARTSQCLNSESNDTDRQKEEDKLTERY